MIFFRNNHYQQTSIINSSNKIVGSLYSKQNTILNYFFLKKINDSLVDENAKLRSKLGIQTLQNPLQDTSFTREVKIDTANIHTAFLEYKAVKALNNTIDQKINYLTLDIGKNAGIEKNMAVIGANGIVGKISHVSEHYSLATSILSEGFNISAMTSDGTVGKVVWEGKKTNELLLTGIPQSVKLKKGDTIKTSGYSSIFPENIIIGYVIKPNNTTSYKLVSASNFFNLHFVYVIREKTNQELNELESKMKEQ
ncbi:MAG TPA: rod shape-determining protein MreC [Chitinophagaceae bacterium]|nr:MAG: rod shape-determining protein MreC [Bacteroidetes bacterium OLB11]HMN33635.1 rod shape-determining protein MreC [Chitinophagaceae bacterium]